MADAAVPRRAYDDRINRVLRLVEGLTERGHEPRVIELDGLYVELGGAVRPPPTADTRHAPDPASAADDPDAVDSYRSSVRSYRQRAHADLERRMREARQ